MAGGAGGAGTARRAPRIARRRASKDLCWMLGCRRRRLVARVITAEETCRGVQQKTHGQDQEASEVAGTRQRKLEQVVGTMMGMVVMFPPLSCPSALEPLLGRFTRERAARSPGVLTRTVVRGGRAITSRYNRLFCPNPAFPFGVQAPRGPLSQSRLFRLSDGRPRHRRPSWTGGRVSATIVDRRAACLLFCLELKVKRSLNALGRCRPPWSFVPAHASRPARDDARLPIPRRTQSLVARWVGWGITQSQQSRKPHRIVLESTFAVFSQVRPCLSSPSLPPSWSHQDQPGRRTSPRLPRARPEPPGARDDESDDSSRG